MRGIESSFGRPRPPADGLLEGRSVSARQGLGLLATRGSIHRVSHTIDRKQIDEELEAARQARAAGNEGKARVCARRAAGWAIGLSFEGEVPAQQRVNAYGLLRWYRRRPSASAQLRAAAERLTARITEEHTLPHEQDPLEDARRLVKALLG